VVDAPAVGARQGPSGARGLPRAAPRGPAGAEGGAVPERGRVEKHVEKHVEKRVEERVVERAVERLVRCLTSEATPRGATWSRTRARPPPGAAVNVTIAVWRDAGAPAA
jgi:hypothetical protein